MKRKGKCVNKKAYTWKHDALSTAAFFYKHYGVEQALYTCPSCQDFHLSTKYCNLQQYHRRWLFRLGRELKNEEYKFNAKFFPEDNAGFKVKKPKKEKPESKVSIYRKQTTLPLTTQRELLRNLDRNPYPQPPTFWSRIRGIIINKRAGN